MVIIGDTVVVLGVMVVVGWMVVVEDFSFIAITSKYEAIFVAGDLITDFVVYLDIVG